MTTQQILARLQPLRSNVSRAHQAVLDKLAAGATANDCQGRVTMWREAVRTYLTELQRMETNPDQLRQHGKRLRKELEAGFPGDDLTGVDAWQQNRAFEQTLSEFETLADLHAGPEATRRWLLAQDARLRQTIQRASGPQMTMPKTEAEEVRI